MSFLLDIHTFIWFINGDSQLPKNIISKIRDFNNKCYISIASIWEIAIKFNLGKLSITSNFEKIIDFLVENQIEILPITFNRILHLNQLQYHHRDPFDRIIIAQWVTENLTIISKNQNFKLYNAKIIW